MQRPTTAKPFSFDFKLLRTACIALVSAQVPLLAATLPLGLHAPAVIAQTQSAEVISKIAKAITVRIEGATQGSGVLVKKEGNRYTVLTAWHVVSGQRPGEELDIYTPDGERHSAEKGSIKRLGDFDLSTLSFSSTSNYKIATIGNINDITRGENLFVSGFPINNNNKFRLEKGSFVAKANINVNQGYQLLYHNKTYPGMSGGAVLDSAGSLIGIHGRGEQDVEGQKHYERTIKTGTNKGIPITYFSLNKTGSKAAPSTSHPLTADDYLVTIKELLFKEGREQEVISLANTLIKTKRDSNVYVYRAFAKSKLGDKQGAMSDYNEAIALNSKHLSAIRNRGNIRHELGDSSGAIADYKRVISINPQDSLAYYNLGKVKSDLGDKKGAIIYYSKAIEIDPQDAGAYFNRGNDKFDLGDRKGAIDDYTKAVTIKPQHAEAYYNRGNAKYDLGDKEGAIDDYSKAILLNPEHSKAYNNRGAAKHDTRYRDYGCSDFKKARHLGSNAAIKYLASDNGSWCQDMQE